MKLNEKKTKFMIYKTSSAISDVNLDLYVNNNAIQQVNKFKYLGIVIDETLNWNEHIESIKSHIRTINFILFKMRKILPTKIKFMIYHAHILSRIRYLLPI